MFSAKQKCCCGICESCLGITLSENGASFIKALATTLPIWWSELIPDIVNANEDTAAIWNGVLSSIALVSLFAYYF